jgi:glycolate oxidase FAD binding subunit
LSTIAGNVSVLTPATVGELARMLQQANSGGAAVAPRGSGTKWTWGAVPRRIDAIIATERLNAGTDHCAGDLTATVPAGATLRAVNDVLAHAGQWLPLDPPMGDRATIGGIIATNDSGPRRHKHGAPRDLILGIEMARADGHIARAGGRVVKNVSGYDLGRMMCGSLGTLAVITQATFKLAPIAPASRTVVVRCTDAQAASRLALAIAAAPLAPSAIELQMPANRLLVRFDSTEGAADRQAAAVEAICRSHAAETTMLGGVDEENLWQQHERIVWDRRAEALVLKVAVVPTEIGGFLEHATRAATQGECEIAAIGRAALGVLYFRITAEDAKDAEEQSVSTSASSASSAVRICTELIEELRRYAAARNGSAVVIAAPTDLGAELDAWGDIGSGLPVMRAVKARFDPCGTLCDRFGF